MSNSHLSGWVWGEGGLFCTMWLWFIAMQYISNCFLCFKPTVLGYNLSVERIAEVGTALVSPKSPHRFKAMPMPYSVGHCQPLTSANGMKRTNYCIAVVHPCIWLKPRCDQLFFFCISKVFDDSRKSLLWEWAEFNRGRKQKVGWKSLRQTMVGLEVKGGWRKSRTNPSILKWVEILPIWSLYK